MSQEMTTRSSFFKLVLAFLLTVCGLLAAQAQNTVFEDNRLKAKVTKYSNVSRLDLIRQVFPDAVREKDSLYSAIAHQAIKLRNLFDGSEKKFDDKLSLFISDQMETSDAKSKILWVV